MLSKEFLDSLKTVNEVEDEIQKLETIIKHGKTESYRKHLLEEVIQLAKRSGELIAAEYYEEAYKEVDETESTSNKIEESPSYRSQMKDAGRGRLLP